MSKYIPADKLIAEIDRQKRENLGSPECVCDDILSYIDSLQQEQPEVDLEKEIDKYFNGWRLNGANALVMGNQRRATLSNMRAVARHFYELGLNARKDDNR